MSSTAKKFILLGVVFILLAAIPLTLWFVGRKTKSKSSAVAATKLSFTPAAASAAVGDTVSMDITLDPGTNIVSFVKMNITYDATKVATTEAGLSPNTTAFSSILEGPVYTPGKIAITLSVGADPTKFIQTPTKIATVTFQALSTTDQTPTQLLFDAQTQVLSAATADLPSENVLSSTSPGAITITAATNTPTPTPPATTGTTSPTPTVVPTVTGTPSPTATPVPGASATPTVAQNSSPSCTALNTDKSPSGIAPLAITFTAVGSDTDGTITKATFSFGDGAVQDVTSTGGIGTNSVSVSATHTYNAPGTYTAAAVITDNANGASSSSSCSVTVTVSAQPTPTQAPVVTIAPTGPGETMLGLGAIGLILAILGGLAFFTL